MMANAAEERVTTTNNNLRLQRPKDGASMEQSPERLSPSNDVQSPDIVSQLRALRSQRESLMEEGEKQEITRIQLQILKNESSSTLQNSSSSILESIPGYGSSPAPSSAPRPSDFAGFNRLLTNTIIKLPDTDINEMLLYQYLSISLRDLECKKLKFDDIRLTQDFRDPTEAGVGLSIVGLGLQCSFDFQWSYIFLNGNGHAVVDVADSGAQFGLDFFSENFAIRPPHSATVTSCSTDINIQGIEFSGNIASEVYNLMEHLLLDVVDSLLNEKICVELNALGSGFLDELLLLVYDFISPFLEPVDDWRYDITYPEYNMFVPEDVELLSWNTEDSTLGSFMDAALDRLDEETTQMAPDPLAPSGKTFPNGTEYPDGHDLGINVLLRKYLLDDKGTFLLDLGDSTNVFSTHDQLTNTNMSLLSLKVFGLDTFTDMQPLMRYGNHTLQNVLSWDYLAFEAVVKMEIVASTLEDSVIRDAHRVDPYVEEMVITIGVEDIELVVAVLVALDPARMYKMEMGALLEVMSMVPCVLEALHEVSLAGLNVSIGDIMIPTIDGLVSPGLDRVLVDAGEIAFFMFKGTVLQMLPNLFQSTVRDLLTGLLANVSCPEFKEFEEDSFVDIRDLLFSGEYAVEVGATGLAPYGDLASTVYGIAEGMWEEEELDGVLGINGYVIGPLTNSTSGVEGTISIPGVLYNFTTNEENQLEFKTLVNRFEFSMFDLRIENLNTIMHPMAVLQPVNHPYITESTVNIGPLDGAPLNVTVGMHMSLDIADSPLAMNNTLSVGLSVASIELFLELLTMISTNNLLNFQLGDGLDVNCYFATLPAPDLDLKGYRVKGSKQLGIEVRKFLAKMSDLRLSIDCQYCNHGFEALSEMVDVFDRSGVTDILSYRIPLVLEEFAISETMQVHFDRWVFNAPYACPHRAESKTMYTSPSSWETPEFSQLSVETSDTIFFSAIVAGQLGLYLVMETHSLWKRNETDPMSGQRRFVAPEGSSILDWTNLLDTIDTVANDVRNYFGGPQLDEESGEEDLGVNLLIRDYLADEDGTVDILKLFGDEPLDFKVEGVVVMIHAISVRGLDTFTRFDLLKPIAPQTVLNSIHLKELAIDLKFSIKSSVTPQQIVTGSFKFKDLNATIPLFAAIDLNFLRDLEVGHFMLGGKIFPCFMAAAVDIHFPQALITLGEFLAPVFVGFLPETQRALNKSLAETYELYGGTVMKAVPVMFDVTARAFVNTYIKDYLKGKAECTHIRDWSFNETEPGEVPYAFDSFVDFRELFLVEENATQLGARGKATYGDTFRSLTLPITKELLGTDPKTGLSNINGLVGMATKFFFNESGSVVIPGNIFASDALDFDVGSMLLNASFSIGDLHIQNIDSLGEPLQVLTPVYMEPLFVDNSVGIGLNNRPLRASLRLTIELLTFKKIDDQKHGEFRFFHAPLIGAYIGE
jgi:hypothetical protein